MRKVENVSATKYAHVQRSVALGIDEIVLDSCHHNKYAKLMVDPGGKSRRRARLWTLVADVKSGTEFSM
jgi:hypothetical protein